MKIPMMPKGVEHMSGLMVQIANFHVKIPMMPKGVEHISSSAATAAQVGVKIPMMPKGVEHPMPALLYFVTVRCEDSYDAERR